MGLGSEITHLTVGQGSGMLLVVIHEAISDTFPLEFRNWALILPILLCQFKFNLLQVC